MPFVRATDPVLCYEYFSRFYLMMSTQNTVIIVIRSLCVFGIRERPGHCVGRNN